MTDVYHMLPEVNVNHHSLEGKHWSSCLIQSQLVYGRAKHCMESKADFKAQIDMFHSYSL